MPAPSRSLCITTRRSVPHVVPRADLCPSRCRLPLALSLALFLASASPAFFACISSCLRMPCTLASDVPAADEPGRVTMLSSDMASATILHATEFLRVFTALFTLKMS